MGLELAKAFVKIAVDHTQLASGLRRSKAVTHREMSNMSASIRGAMQRATLEVQKLGNAIAKSVTKYGAFAAAAAGGFAALSIRAAADAEEINSKFEAVFKNLTGDADKFAKTFAGKVGRSVKQVKSQAAGLQDLFVPLGFAREEAFQLTQQMVELTADLASFNNMADADVVASLTSALVGNHQTVRRFGVIINEAAIHQELLNMKVKNGIKSATEMQKVQARLNLILKGTTDAQGDAVRTSGSFTNQMKKLRAEIEDTQVSIGEALLPVMTDLVSSVADITKNFKDWTAETGGLNEILTSTIGIMREFNAVSKLTGTTFALQVSRANDMRRWFSPTNELIKSLQGKESIGLGQWSEFTKDLQAQRDAAEADLIDALSPPAGLPPASPDEIPQADSPAGSFAGLTGDLREAFAGVGRSLGNVASQNFGDWIDVLNHKMDQSPLLQSGPFLEAGRTRIEDFGRLIQDKILEPADTQEDILRELKDGNEKGRRLLEQIASKIGAEKWLTLN